MSISLEGQKCWNWCQHQRYYGPMKYLRNPPKLSTCSSTLNSDLNHHQKEKLTYSGKQFAPRLPPEMFTIWKNKTKQSENTKHWPSPVTKHKPSTSSRFEKKSNAYMVIVQAFSVRLVHLGLAEERKHSSNVWHGIILEKMTSPIRREETHTGEDPESQFRQLFFVLLPEFKICQGQLPSGMVMVCLFFQYFVVVFFVLKC